MTVGAATVALALAGCTGLGDDSPPADQRGAREPEPARAVAPAEASTSSRDPATAPAPPRLADPIRPGRVRLEEGPFTDRVTIQRMSLERGQRPQVKGTMLNRADVSEVLVLELRADFYDPRGRLVGTGVTTFEEAEEFADHPLAFRIRSTQPAPRAASAVLTVPQLVNE